MLAYLVILQLSFTFLLFSRFYVLLTVCMVVFYQCHYIDLFSCIAASLFNKLTCLFTQHVCLVYCPGCPAGSYGQDCESRCHCRNSAECHPVTGECICAPGWHGDSCEQRTYTPSTALRYFCKVVEERKSSSSSAGSRLGP